MNSRSIKNLFLPRQVAYHLKILLISTLLVPVFSWVLQDQAFGPGFLPLLGLIFVQLELFIWLGSRFFERWVGPSAVRNTSKILWGLAVFFLLTLLIAAVINLSFILLTSFISGNGWAGLLPWIIRQEYRGFIIAATVGILFGAIVFFYFQWQDALKREQKLREERLIFQYETLKNQVNPHFLFNSLNTLSSLVHQDPGLAEHFIRKLSSIYRYILENKDADLVSLASEVKFVEDYFYLQKIRDQEKIRLDLQLAPLDKIEIVPISLQLLVENALKHNTASRNRPLRISIGREEKGAVVVKNNLQRKTNLGSSSKIGLKNLSERVKLTMGRDLEVTETRDEFIVKIPVREGFKEQL